MNGILTLALMAITADALPAQSDLRVLEGRWFGHCGWGANMKRNRDQNRILRVAGGNAIEMLEWATATDFIVDPPTKPHETILFEPKRETFTRETGLRFRSGGDVIEFVGEGGKLVMLPGSQDACNGLGGEYRLEKDAAFGAYRPSFPCDRATQPREKAICASPELSMLDQHLTIAYRAAEERIRSGMQSAARDSALRKLKAGQGDWWANQLARCQSAACVPPLYTERIEALAGVAK